LALSRFIKNFLGISPSEPELQKVAEIFGYVPENVELFKLAFRHKSVFEERNSNNERLEFLGDSVLDAIVADYLYKHYPEKDEGFLTKMRSKIVSRNTLNKMARDLGINSLIVAHVERSKHETSLGGNAMEALIGALYLDRGFEVANQLIQERLLLKFVELSKFEKLDFDPKSKLIEHSQKLRFKLRFKTIEDSKKDDSFRTYKSTVKIDGRNVSEGTGSSKKKAEQAAAKIALNQIAKEK
jgi:ribonuclease-3